jgi:protoheme IX farnesyltransferase
MTVASSTVSSMNQSLLRGDQAAPRRLPHLYTELTKARLSALVVLTAGVGFVLASQGPMDWTGLLWTIVGTSLAAGAANALNQIIERRRDGLMQRTRNRPLPSGALSFGHALAFALIIAAAGVTILAALVNLLAAALALLTILIYVALYTPLKVRSSLNTLVGAVCGAIPPMIGWAAARGSIDPSTSPGAWILAAILFVWQLPHFLALAWLYRDDYQRGGYTMLPRVDPTGRLTARVCLLSSLALMPIALMLTLLHVTGWIYALGAMMLGAALLTAAARMQAERSDASARRLFLASLLYLSLLLPLMLIDRGVYDGSVLDSSAYAVSPPHSTAFDDRQSEPFNAEAGS